MTVEVSRADRIYAVLSGDDAEDRACRAIPEDACTAVPGNFLLNLASGAATKLAEQIAGPNVMLPMLLAAIGAPVYLVALLMPVKQAGSLIPQLAVAGSIRSFRLRKWFWTGAGGIQALCLLLMALAVVQAPATVAGFAVVGLLLLFSVASGIGSVAFQDVVAKTIPRGHRGRLLSSRATVGGALTLVAGLVLNFGPDETSSLDTFVLLLVVAAALWGLAALAFACTEETPGSTSGGRSMLGELRAGITLVRRSAPYRRFLGARAGLLAAEIALPFYTLYIAHTAGSDPGLLGALIVSVALANMLSSPIWGALADRSARLAMMASGVLSALSGLVLLGAGSIAAALPPWAFAVPLLLGGFSEAGARVSRQTYLVDFAPDDERPLYVAFSNTFAGGLALASGLLGVLASMTGTATAIIALIFIAATGALTARYLPEAEKHQ